MRDEVERYGHYGLAAEPMYDHPFQWSLEPRAGSRPHRRQLFGRVGVPYADEMVAAASTDVYAWVNQDHDGLEALLARYPEAQVRNFDGRPEITELDALIAYLQMLGTLVDF